MSDGARNDNDKNNIIIIQCTYSMTYENENDLKGLNGR